MKAWLLLSSSRLFHLHLFPLHLPPPLSFTPLCRWHQLWTSRINNLLLYVALSSFLFFILRLQNHPGDPSDVCRPLKGFWVRVELLLLTPPLSEQLKKAQTSHWCRAMQIKPRGAVDECVRGVLLSAHFHFFFLSPPCCAGEEEVLTEPLCSLRKVNIEQRNHLRMRSGLRQQTSSSFVFKPLHILKGQFTQNVAGRFLFKCTKQKHKMAPRSWDPTSIIFDSRIRKPHKTDPLSHHK